MDITDSAQARYFAGVTILIAVSQCIFALQFIGLDLSIPAISDDLHLPGDMMAWVVSAYLLVYGGFLIVGGQLADKFGRRRYCLYGFALFTVGMVLSATAVNIEMFFAGCAVAGLGTALFGPTSFSLINILLPEGPVRARAFAIFGIAQGIVQIVAFCGEGYVVTKLGWRWIFIMNLPLVALAAGLAVRYIPVHKKSPLGERVDLAGAMLVTVTATLFLVSLNDAAKYGWVSWQSLGLMAAAAVALIMFLMLQRRLDQPLTPIGLYVTPNFLGATFASSCMMASIGASYGLLSLFLQRLLGFSAVMAGAAMLPYSAAFIVAGRIVSHGTSAAAARLLNLFGCAILAFGCLWPVIVPANQNYLISILPGLVCIGIGVGITLPLTIAQATASVQIKLQGIAMGMLMTCQQIGLALGVSVGLTVVSLDRQAGDTPLGAYHHGFVSASLMALLALAICFLFTANGRKKTDTGAALPVERVTAEAPASRR